MTIGKKKNFSNLKGCVIVLRNRVQRKNYKLKRVVIKKEQ